MTFQDNLRLYREKRGYSSSELAKLLDIPYTTYKGYENQGREPKYIILCKIADILNVSLDDLLGHSPLNENEHILTILKNCLNKSSTLFPNKSEDIKIKVSKLDDDYIFFDFKLKGRENYTIPIKKEFITNKIKDLNTIEEIRKENDLKDFIFDSVFYNATIILINVLKLKFDMDKDPTVSILLDDLKAIRLAKTTYSKNKVFL